MTLFVSHVEKLAILRDITARSAFFLAKEGEISAAREVAKEIIDGDLRLTVMGYISAFNVQWRLLEMEKSESEDDDQEEEIKDISWDIFHSGDEW